MSETTSSPRFDGWSNPNDARKSPVQTQRPEKRKRTESEDHVTREFGLMRNGGKKGLPRFIGSGSGIYFIRTVYDILSRNARPVDKNNVRGDLVPGEEDELVEPGPEQIETPATRSRAPFWRQDEIIEDTARGAPTVNFDHLVQWTKSYFENWHPAYPFLHGPEVLQTFERVASVGISNISEADATIVRSMVSISLADSRQLGVHQSAIPNNLVFLNSEHIASSIVFALGCPASLKSLQAVLCVQLFLVSMLRYNMASRLGGVIVRMSFHLGLHRCPVRYSNFNNHEAAMRKRIWWSLYGLERIVCQSLGHPLAIVDDDCDVCLPLNELHKDSPAGESAEARPLLFMTLIAKHARLRGLILELRNKSIAARHDTVDRALHVQSELAKWANEVQEKSEGRLEFEDENNDSSNSTRISPFQGSLLMIKYHESIINLNRPLLASNVKSPASRAALQSCISSARALIDAIISNDPRQKGASSQNILLYPSMTWSVWMGCFVLTYAALEGETTLSSAQKYARKALYILKQLSARGTAWPESCARGVEHLASALQRKQDEGYEVIQETPVSPTNSNGQQTREAAIRSDGSCNRSNPDSQGQIPSEKAGGTPNLPATPTASQDGRRSSQVTSLGGPESRLQDRAGIFTSQRPSQSSELHSFQSRVGLGTAQFTPTQTPMPVSDMLPAMDIYSQEWFDPLGPLDFSNFAQIGLTDSTLGFGFS
ncbi:hypothetical protein PFICI_09784 [Pestalotiopsis fici W106-1]|uniref:Xylanolytic transcriptional activator regulatory domain-containing protein n=1 Tax=Pestalotiopsis fici (strain W106-1 / CGMCC3.15140) TaxID=1229662 RepID=W3WX99_PESFW|nr:uncharacterized protein PFICI_09784 [Pestalotiopsis fici W106-1]ETS77722.1 hypothetical protein PFICI_09784 [Pestalotiopsis fici W106-1]